MRIGALELLEGCLRAFEIAIAQLRERRFIGASFSRVDRDLLAVKVQCGGLQALQTGVQILACIALTLVSLSEIIALHFEGAAQGGDFLAHRCELVLQIELAAAALLHPLKPGLHVVDAPGEVALHEIELAAQIENGASRLVIGKELRLSRLSHRPEQGERQPDCTRKPAGSASRWPQPQRCRHGDH